MLKAIIPGTVLALAAIAGPAAAQSGLLMDWGIADGKAAVTAAGATVTGSGVEDGHPYITGTTSEGMKFLVYGTVCTGTTAPRCKGMNLSSGFTQASDAAVDKRVKEIDRMAIGARNGGDNSLDINRYIIFDNGITRANLQTNIEVFIDIAHDIWNGGGT